MARFLGSYRVFKQHDETGSRGLSNRLTILESENANVEKFAFGFLPEFRMLNSCVERRFERHETGEVALDGAGRQSSPESSVQRPTNILHT